MRFKGQGRASVYDLFVHAELHFMYGWIYMKTQTTPRDMTCL